VNFQPEREARRPERTTRSPRELSRRVERVIRSPRELSRRSERAFLRVLRECRSGSE
jgi:hypothetical protein